MNIKTSKVTSLYTIIITIAVISTIHVAPISAGTVSFLFYDETGNQLNYNQVIDRMTNGHGTDILSEGTFDADTLQALTLNTSFQNGSAVAVPFNQTGKKQAWMVHWNTRNTGYSSFVLDNAGLGFSASQTVVFNERLAKDVQRQFNLSYSSRNGRLPADGEYLLLKANSEICMNELKALTSNNEKGRKGQECVDLYAQAMRSMLSADGTSQARVLGDKAVWGVSIGEASSANYQTKIDDLVSLIPYPQHRWARIIMDETSNAYFNSVGAVLTYASQRGVNTMGQLFDSSIQKSLSLSTFKTRVNAALNRTDFRQFTAWEVGNEVNGGWLGTGMNAKIAYAAQAIRGNTFHSNKNVCLTFYWYGMEDTKKTSLFNWIDSNIMKSTYKNAIVDNIDCVALSIYTDQQPLGFSWDLVMTKLASVFPGKQVMIGELGFVDPSESLFFGEGSLQENPPRTMLDLADSYIRTRYPTAFATPTTSAQGGVFWWYYDQEMVGQQPLWHSLHDTYCETYPDLCGGM